MAGSRKSQKLHDHDHDHDDIAVTIDSNITMVVVLVMLMMTTTTTCSCLYFKDPAEDTVSHPYVSLLIPAYTLLGHQSLKAPKPLSEFRAQAATMTSTVASSANS